MDHKTFNYKLHNLLKMPPSKAIKKVNNKINRKINDKINEKNDLKRDTHIESNLRVSYSFIDYRLIDVSKIDLKAAEYLLDMYLNHYFDLLGSGFVKVDYNIEPLGVEGIRYDMSPKINAFDYEGKWLSKILLMSHVNYSMDIWKIINRGYTPIDWNMDFKSGFRYSQKVWYKKQPIGKFKGADIKIPWEISRMQHLPQIAIFSLVFTEKRDRIINEFKNEVLDFSMANPIRMGANWACTMDVGIRASNILIAHDILKGMDENNILDDEFEEFFGNFIYEHGEFIIHNLEWGDGKNNNHYMSDICGLLFISSYLERNEAVNSWLAFSIQELINCMEGQFYDDGGNFESSTSYHRLSSELIIYSTALIYGILKTDKRKALEGYNYNLVKRLLPLDKQKFNLDNEKFFPDWYLDRLFRSGLFTMDITKENGRIPQIGDNDSGRFFKFSPVGEFITIDYAAKKYKNLEGYKGRKEVQEYFDEDVLNHSSLISAINGIFDFNGFENFAVNYPLEKSVIESLAKRFKIKKEYRGNKINTLEENLKLKYNKKTVIEFKDYMDKGINTDNLKFISYPFFGLYIFKCKNFYLSIFAGGNGQNGAGGHSHNDKLSFELNLCGKDVFVDPGTYLYTPISERRNEFRSVKVHNVLIVDDKEQNEFISLFSMKDETRCNVIEYGKDFIKLKLSYRDVVITRGFKILPDKLIINDFCNKEFEVNFNRGERYSNGYGKVSRK